MSRWFMCDNDIRFLLFCFMKMRFQIMFKKFKFRIILSTLRNDDDEKGLYRTSLSWSTPVTSKGYSLVVTSSIFVSSICYWPYHPSIIGTRSNWSIQRVWSDSEIQVGKLKKTMSSTFFLLGQHHRVKFPSMDLPVEHTSCLG